MFGLMPGDEVTVTKGNDNDQENGDDYEAMFNMGLVGSHDDGRPRLDAETMRWYGETLEEQADAGGEIVKDIGEDNGTQDAARVFQWDQNLCCFQ